MQRGYLVDRCPRCSAWMPRATGLQHGALQMVLEDIAVFQDWPPGSGRLIGPSTWWQLVIPAFDRVQKQEAEMMPAFDGIGFDGNGFDFVRGPRLRRRLNVAEISEIIEYVKAWCSDKGVPERRREPA